MPHLTVPVTARSNGYTAGFVECFHQRIPQLFRPFETSYQVGEKFPDGSERPFSAYTQRLFRWAKSSPGADCCPPAQWRRHPGRGHKLRQEPFRFLPFGTREVSNARRSLHIHHFIIDLHLEGVVFKGVQLLNETVISFEEWRMRVMSLQRDGGLIS